MILLFPLWSGVREECLLPPEPEPYSCLAYFPRFYWNKWTNRCQQFIYGGCGATANNFGTLEECYAFCQPDETQHERDEWRWTGDYDDKAISIRRQWGMNWTRNWAAPSINPNRRRRSTCKDHLCFAMSIQDLSLILGLGSSLILSSSSLTSLLKSRNSS